MPNYLPFLKKFLPSLEREVTPAEKALLAAEQSIPEVTLAKSEAIIPEVEGSVTSKFNASDLPIEEADTLSPKLTNVDLPETDLASKYKKMKQMLPVLAAGTGTAMYLNSGSDTIPPSPPIVSKNQEEMSPQETPRIPAKVDTQIEPESESEKLLKKYQAFLKRPSAEERVGSANDNDELNSMINFGADERVASKKALEQAQKSQSQVELINQLGKAASLIGSSMAGTKPGQADAIFDKNIDLAKQIPQEYLARIENEKQDPNSAVSKGYRELAGKLGANIQGNASAADIEKLLPQFFQSKRNSENNKLKSEMAKDARESQLLAMQLRAAQSREAKEDVALEKDKQKLGDVTSFSKQARGNAAQIENLVNQGERLQTLIDAVPKNARGEPDMNKLTPLQKDELIRTFDVMLAGKSTVSGQQELLKSANSIYNDVAKVKQYLTGNKAYTNESGLLKSIIDTVNREKGLAIEKIKDMSYQNSLGFDRLNKKDPEFVKEMLKAKANMDDYDLEIRKNGYRAPDINRLLNEGYDKAEIAKAAAQGVKASELKPKGIASNKKQQPKLIQEVKSIRPEDVDSLSDEEVEAELRKRGL